MRADARGRVTIPKHLRERYGLLKGVEVGFVDVGDGIRLVKRSDGARRIASIRGTIKLKHAKSVDEYIEQIRGR